MTPWWRGAVLYEIYVRSFADADGDGVGDLAGVRSRLAHVARLGVDGIWLTPFYPSPGADHGYDVADYCDVDPLFGSLDELDALLADAHALGLRVLVDLVPNHTSTAHPWFRDHPERYVWADEPNNWLSVFGGSAWAKDEERGRFYLHLFAPEQPDLDWHRADVREAFEEIIRFWLDRGVDGLRIDVAHGLFKDPDLLDELEPVPGSEPGSFDRRRAIDRPELHPLYRRWRALVDAYDGDRCLVGEVDLTDPARVASYVRPDELHLAFNFTLLRQPWEAVAMRAAIDATLAALDTEGAGATATWVLESHDVTRLPTRFGDPRRARAGLLLVLALPGTAFLYQGQELGLPEVDLPPEHRRDPVFLRTHGARLGRDGCRVPLPWDGSAPAAGFGGPPWLPMPEGWERLAVAAQESDPASMLELTRRALAARRQLDGPLEWEDAPPGALAFTRGRHRVLVNVDGPPLALPAGEPVVASEELAGELPAGAAAWMRR